jgi:TolB-like protein
VDEPEDGDDQGDEQVQDMLVGMVRLQAGKMRVSEFVDDRSKMLSDIADQAKEEYDKIAQDAMRTMDEASSKVSQSLSPFTFFKVIFRWWIFFWMVTLVL